jgi:hypothetical protein
MNVWEPVDKSKQTLMRIVIEQKADIYTGKMMSGFPMSNFVYIGPLILVYLKNSQMIF